MVCADQKKHTNTHDPYQRSPTRHVRREPRSAHEVERVDICHVTQIVTIERGEDTRCERDGGCDGGRVDAYGSAHDDRRVDVGDELRRHDVQYIFIT